MYGAQPSVTMAAIRVEIGDQPRLCVPPGRYELAANPADGVTTSFPLKFRKAILTTLRVWIAVLPTERNANPPLYVEVQSNDATSSWSAGVDASSLPVVTFDLPPPINSLIGVRYDVVMFTDAEIATYIPDNVRSTASLTLKAIHYSLIPVMLADRDALMVSRIGERTDDPAQWIQAQRAMMTMLAAVLDNEPGEGPAGGVSSTYGCGSYWR